MTPTVYVVQNPHCRQGERLVPKFNLAPAERYGPLKFLLSPNAAPWRTEDVMAELRAKLSGFTSEDYLLLIGNPVLIGLATAVAADAAGRVQFLQWNGTAQGYLAVEATVFDEETED